MGIVSLPCGKETRSVNVKLDVIRGQQTMGVQTLLFPENPGLAARGTTWRQLSTQEEDGCNEGRDDNVPGEVRDLSERLYNDESAWVKCWMPLLT